MLNFHLKTGVINQGQLIPDSVDLPDWKTEISALPMSSYREWFTNTKSGKDPINSIDEILIRPSVFISDLGSVQDGERLSALKIGYVLSLELLDKETLQQTDTGWASNLDYVFQDKQIKRVIIPLWDDGTNQDLEIISAFEALESLYSESRKSTKGLLIHCRAGISLSPVLLACLISKHNRISIKEAVEHIGQFRAIGLNEDLVLHVAKVLELPLE